MIVANTGVGRGQNYRSVPDRFGVEATGYRTEVLSHALLISIEELMIIWSSLTCN